MTWDRSDKHDHAPRWVGGVTGDPLDLIEGDARHVLTPGRANWGWEASLARDVLALVEVARAARPLLERFANWQEGDDEFGYCLGCGHAAHLGHLPDCELAAALALAPLDGPR